MCVRAAAGRFGGGSGLYHRSGLTGAYEVAFGRDGHFAGTGLAVEIRLKAFAGRIDQNERFRPKQRSVPGLKDSRERLEHFGTKLQGSAHAVPAGHQVGFGRRFDFKGRHGYPSAVSSIKGCSPIVGSIGFEAQNTFGVRRSIIPGSSAGFFAFCFPKRKKIVRSGAAQLIGNACRHKHIEIFWNEYVGGSKGRIAQTRELHAQIGAVFDQIRRRLQVECNACSGASDAVRGDQIQAVFVRRKDEINGDFAFGRFAFHHAQKSMITIAFQY